MQTEIKHIKNRRSQFRTSLGYTRWRREAANQQSLLLILPVYRSKVISAYTVDLYSRKQIQSPLFTLGHALSASWRKIDISQYQQSMTLFLPAKYLIIIRSPWGNANIVRHPIISFRWPVRIVVTHFSHGINIMIMIYFTTLRVKWQQYRKVVTQLYFGICLWHAQM